VGRYDYEQWARAQLREEQRQLRAEAAADKAAQRERKGQETAAGRAEAEKLNAELTHRVNRLQHILVRGLDRPARVDLSGLLRQDEPPQLNLGEYAAPLPKPDWADFAPPAPGVLAGLFGSRGRHERRLVTARDEYERACRDYDSAEAARQQWVRSEAVRHDGVVHAHCAEVERHNREVEALAAGIENRDRESVQAYLEIALSRTPIPNELPRQSKLPTPRVGSRPWYESNSHPST
jgi:restriction system protein